MQCRGIVLRRCQRRDLLIKKARPRLGARHACDSAGKQRSALLGCQPPRLSIALGAGLMGFPQRIQVFQLFCTPTRLSKDLIHPRFSG